MRGTTRRVFLLFILISKGVLILRGGYSIRRVTGDHECTCVCVSVCVHLRFTLGPSLLCSTQGQPPQAALPRLLAACGQLGGRPGSGRKEETRLFLPGTSCIPSLRRLHSHSCSRGSHHGASFFCGPQPWTLTAPSPSSSDQPKGTGHGLSLGPSRLPCYLPCSASQLYNQGLLINSLCLNS